MKHERTASIITSAERNALRVEFNEAPDDSFFPEVVISVVTGMSTAKLAVDRMTGRGLPYYKVGSAVRYRAGDARAFMRSVRVEPKS